MRRAKAWTGVLVGPKDDRRVALLKPGSPIAGPKLFAHEDELVAQLVLQSITRPGRWCERVPYAGSPIGVKRQAAAALVHLEGGGPA